jgi:hypothetical protein
LVKDLADDVALGVAGHGVELKSQASGVSQNVVLTGWQVVDIDDHITISVRINEESIRREVRAEGTRSIPDSRDVPEFGRSFAGNIHRSKLTAMPLIGVSECVDVPPG